MPRARLSCCFHAPESLVVALEHSLPECQRGPGSLALGNARSGQRLARSTKHLVVAGAPKRIGEPVEPTTQPIVARQQFVQDPRRVLQFEFRLHNARQPRTALLQPPRNSCARALLRRALQHRSLRELPGLGVLEKGMHQRVDAAKRCVHTAKHGAHSFGLFKRSPQRTDSTRERGRHLSVRVADTGDEGVRALRHRHFHARVGGLARR